MGENIINRFNVLVKKTYYIYKRFGIESTFVLLYHKEPISVVDLSKFVRLSDHLIEVDENHYFIIFEFTSQENAYKASQNIIHSLDKHFNSCMGCFIAIDSFDVAKSPQNVLNRLKQILIQVRKNPCVRVEVEDILDR
ncbi:MAG: hypothetical protein PHO62_01205 [Sulfurimonas sp.]|uniref:hypothetical protein n=1 Tax=Sulfurimonas sp. TaxID=2022749 RepID=UPI00261EC555|nr:hypothetical protein [Sulfurimonas sp.]MDD5372023.1 hypothetical protein [Sulfurimonas sp.]